MQNIDDSNLKYGIVHQHISANYMLINPVADDLRWFSFSHVARIVTTESFEGGEEA